MVHNSSFHVWNTLYWADISFDSLRRSSCFWSQPIEISSDIVLNLHRRWWQKPGRHKMQAVHKLTRYILIRTNDVLAILLQRKKVWVIVTWKETCLDVMLGQVENSKQPLAYQGQIWDWKLNRFKGKRIEISKLLRFPFENTDTWGFTCIAFVYLFAH